MGATLADVVLKPEGIPLLELELPLLRLAAAVVLVAVAMLEASLLLNGSLWKL